MHKKTAISIILAQCFCVIVALSAQSNQLVDEVLAQNPVQFGHAAYLALTAGGQIPETATTEEAATWATQHKWAPPGLKATDALPLDQYSFILMKAFDLKGGIFFTIFPGPRYALRELSFLRIASSPVWSDKKISGDEAMRMLTKAMDLKEKK